MKITGADQLVGALKKAANLDDVKNTIKLNTTEMNRKTQRNAPVDTGHLKRMVTIGFEDAGMTGRVASTAEYAMYQEYGTRFQSGKPHVRPAFKEVEQQFIRDMQRLMK